MFFLPSFRLVFDASIQFFSNCQSCEFICIIKNYCSEVRVMNIIMKLLRCFIDKCFNSSVNIRNFLHLKKWKKNNRVISNILYFWFYKNHNFVQCVRLIHQWITCLKLKFAVNQNSSQKPCRRVFLEKSILDDWKKKASLWPLPPIPQEPLILITSHYSVTIVIKASRYIIGDSSRTILSSVYLCLRNEINNCLLFE